MAVYHGRFANGESVIINQDDGGNFANGTASWFYKYISAAVNRLLNII